MSVDGTKLSKFTLQATLYVSPGGSGTLRLRVGETWKVLALRVTLAGKHVNMRVTIAHLYALLHSSRLMGLSEIFMHLRILCWLKADR